MSFILDALKKSEAERQRQAGPTLLQVRVTPPRSRLPVWAMVLAGLLVVNTAILAVALLRKHDTPASAASPAPAPTAAAPAAAAPPPPAVAVSAAPATAPPTTAPAAATPATTPPAVIPPPAFTVPSSDTSGAVREDGGNPADYAPALPRAAGTAATDAADAAGTEDLPTLQDLLSGGMSVPDMQLSLHFYDVSPRTRFVWINGRMFHEGDATSDGARVERIVPRGVVLSWRGRRFILPRAE